MLKKQTPTQVFDSDVEHFVQGRNLPPDLIGSYADVLFDSSCADIRRHLESVVQYFDDQRLEREYVATMRAHALHYVHTFKTVADFEDVLNEDILVLSEGTGHCIRQGIYLQFFSGEDEGFKDCVFLDENGGCWTKETLAAVWKSCKFRIQHFSIWR